MPKHQNLNARQEAFAQKVAAGSSQRQAYLDAGYTAATPEVADTDASTLVRNPKVAARVKELQRQNALAAQVSVASVTEMYLEIYRGAMSAKEYAPAATAVTGIAKLHGLVIDRQQIEAVIRKPSFDPNADPMMSEADWLEKFGGGTVIDHQPLEQIEQLEPRE